MATLAGQETLGFRRCRRGLRGRVGTELLLAGCPAVGEDGAGLIWSDAIAAFDLREAFREMGVDGFAVGVQPGSLGFKEVEGARDDF